jgi:hypothetical protein
MRPTQPWLYPSPVSQSHQDRTEALEIMESLQLPRLHTLCQLLQLSSAYRGARTLKVLYSLSRQKFQQIFPLRVRLEYQPVGVLPNRPFVDRLQCQEKIPK